MNLRRLFHQLEREGVKYVFNLAGNAKGEQFEPIGEALETWGPDDEREWLITTNALGTRHLVLCDLEGEPFFTVWGVVDPPTAWLRIEMSCCFEEWP